MGKIVVELTNRCNLACRHCFSGRHGGRDDLPLDLLGRILQDARGIGFTHLSYTGGDPTVHPQFEDVLRDTVAAGYSFGLNTNGWNFTTIYPHLKRYRDALRIVTFSLDGATEATHDRLRGRGVYRRVMQAISVCVVEDIPFSINMVVTAHNRHEVNEMAELAAALGSRGLRFGHLMPSPMTTRLGFDLSPWQRKLVEAEIWSLQARHPIPIAMAPGHHTTSLFPCAPLHLQEINVDCYGNVTKCCHLSGQGGGTGDVVGNLREISFVQAYRTLTEENERFHRDKLRHLASGEFVDTDFFPCWYCSLHYAKVDWLKEVPDHAWAPLVRAPLAGPA